MGARETLKVKILLKGSEENPESIRVELFSENDYFFLYKHE